MPNPEPCLTPIDCIFAAITGFMLPFYLTAAGGNMDLARDAIAELIEAYTSATAAELDLAGRSLGYSAAAMDNLNRSMRPGLSDSKVLRYRASAIALGRSADHCRKLLDAMQTKREQHAETAAVELATPMPDARPAPVVPPPPSLPPRGTPPAQPKGSAYPPSLLDDDPAFASDIEEMRRNINVMLGDLRALADDPAPEAPAAEIASATPQQTKAIHPGHAAGS